MKLNIENGLVLQTDGTFIKGQVCIDQGIIQAVIQNKNELPAGSGEALTINAENRLVSPGLIDTHIHGGNGFSFTEEKGSYGMLEQRLSSIGVTAILPTGTSLPPEETEGFIRRVKALAENNPANQVEILGIYMEGPYINRNKRGAHREEYIRSAQKDEVLRFLEQAGGLIKVWALAPEIKENREAVELLAVRGVSVSIAHTEADYREAYDAFSAGANRVTHTFNTMPPLSHRYEGIITAAWQQSAFMELIADGHHVSPTVIKMFLAASDPGRVMLVSDNNEFAGSPEGTYTQGSRLLTISAGQIKTETGALAGSIANLNACVQNMVRWGLSPGAALKMATENPARSLGVFDRKGSLTRGKDADIVIFDEKLDPVMTIKGGRVVYEKPSV
ncbi:N-acetylglucosamine-6-phosphate deacetylase [Spirochaetia bacterium]|nr:N-acetylglucosamine-6-phosphate deacetylase [Spirochaetia bacterium]